MNNLAGLTIPKGVSEIGFRFCFGCSALASLTIPDSVKTIGESAFSTCTSLTSVVIPHGVTSIAENAFVACESLSSVQIPGSVTSIGKDAFGKSGDDLVCDKSCESGPEACNTQCGHRGCTVESLKTLSCPGTGNCAGKCDSNGANTLALSLAVTSAIMFTSYSMV